MKHGVKPEELREVGTIWESLDFGFAVDDTVLKLCIEEHPDFHRCLAHHSVPYFPLAILINHSANLNM